MLPITDASHKPLNGVVEVKDFHHRVMKLFGPCCSGEVSSLSYTHLSLPTVSLTILSLVLSSFSSLREIFSTSFSRERLLPGTGTSTHRESEVNWCLVYWKYEVPVVDVLLTYFTIFLAVSLCIALVPLGFGQTNAMPHHNWVPEPKVLISPKIS